MPIDVPDGSTTVSDNANVLVGVAGVFTAGAETGVVPQLVAGVFTTGVKLLALFPPSGAFPKFGEVATDELKPPELPKPPD